MVHLIPNPRTMSWRGFIWNEFGDPAKAGALPKMMPTVPGGVGRWTKVRAATEPIVARAIGHLPPSSPWKFYKRNLQCWHDITLLVGPNLEVKSGSDSGSCVPDYSLRRLCGKPTRRRTSCWNFLEPPGGSIHRPFENDYSDHFSGCQSRLYVFWLLSANAHIELVQHDILNEPNVNGLRSTPFLYVYSSSVDACEVREKRSRVHE
jgi:hypothetical protein